MAGHDRQNCKLAALQDICRSRTHDLPHCFQPAQPFRFHVGAGVSRPGSVVCSSSASVVHASLAVNSTWFVSVAADDVLLSADGEVLWPESAVGIIAPAYGNFLHGRHFRFSDPILVRTWRRVERKSARWLAFGRNCKCMRGTENRENRAKGQRLW